LGPNMMREFICFPILSIRIRFLSMSTQRYIDPISKHLVKVMQIIISKLKKYENPKDIRVTY